MFLSFANERWMAISTVQQSHQHLVGSPNVFINPRYIEARYSYDEHVNSMTRTF